jgi:hypothetical protein
MKTLYELLGALPDDDAEDIRAAFRKAVKSAHPDINPGDPDAAIKFRQIVRANEILVDQEQRAVYDHLLDLARIEQEAVSKQAVAAAVYKVASGTMALAGLSVFAIGGYLLFLQLSVAPVAPSIAPLAETVRKASHTIAQILARPSFAVAHKPSPVDATMVADADPSAPITMSPAAASHSPGPVPAADLHPAPVVATAVDAAWDDRGEGANNGIAYLDLAPKYPAPHLESTVAPFGFGHNGPAPAASAPSNDARNSNAQNSIPLPNATSPGGAAAPKHGEKSGASPQGPKVFRMPPPRAEMQMMAPPPVPSRMAVQDMSRQESGASSGVMRWTSF